MAVKDGTRKMLARRGLQLRLHAAQQCRCYCASTVGGDVVWSRVTRGSVPQPASEQELYVSYTAPAELRRRLTSLAQQVMLADAVAGAPLPSLRIPRADRVRDGFWFMHFADAATAERTIDRLDGKPFATACGTLAGELQVDHGDHTGHVRCMLNIPKVEPCPVREWLHARFSVHGDVEHVLLPRRKCNWDSGLAFVQFRTPDDADQALEALDGTPGPTPGCNMYLDYAVRRSLYELRPHPDVDPYDAPPVPKREVYT